MNATQSLPLAYHSQWDCIRANLGEWRGSFTQLSPVGEVLQDTPSLLTLEEDAEQTRITLTLVRSPGDAPPDQMVREFRHPGPGPGVPFFETGAFSQGSLFWSPFGAQGTELALTGRDRRLRLVQLYDTNQLRSLTLIREVRVGSGATESLALTVDQLLGIWEGEAVTLYPDGGVSAVSRSQLTLHRQGDRLDQSLEVEGPTGSQAIASCARIEGSALYFDQGSQAVRVLLLPGGASATGPVTIQRQQPFFLEAGWLLEPGYRQRLIRRYDTKGDWLGVTLVQERKVG